jgi:phage major head subunit gpT-like protein
VSVDTAKAVAVANDLTVVFRSSALAAQPYYPTLCTLSPSSRKSEDVGLPGAVPAIREWLGDRQEHDLRAAKFNVEHGLYEGTVRIPRADYEDDAMGLHRMQVAQLGQRAALHPDKLLVDMIMNGAATACWDGQFFYDTDHSFGDSGSQDNDLTYDCTDHTAPTNLEMRAAIRQAVNAMIAFVDDQGEPLYQPTVDRLSAVEITVPTELRSVAIEAAEAAVLNSGDTNVRIDQYQIRTIPRFTSAVTFWTHLTSDIIRPFVFFERTPIREEISGLDSIEKKDVLFMTEARYSIGYLAWWLSVQTVLN